MKRGRRKGGNKDKVFGCDLAEHLATTNQEIPQVLRSCSEFIEEHGVVDGIYRLSGVSSNTQKLRSEFDTEGTPDLYKDVYLQDIHCVSSLCKAYFRELPNPLLTYQLYDHFAEAVAVQLEHERLVKIKEVLKELPVPHYRTLEYLMRHLVRMSTHSSETNMHSRNLAIVWAPNLLRSKDIEVSGFNGTAAFMEVRVQSIVVEFVLTHVPQLFPESDSELGWGRERRKSLPSPSLQPGQQDEFIFKAIPFQCPGNMSPGDGPPPMRPYHAIIDGTDKRKGSLKGRKWKSIFNLGGRLHDPRKKNKYAPKEKDQNSLRPAKSMDSLSSGPYTQEDSRHAGTHLSPVAVPPGNTEIQAPGKGGLSSGYAVTYRRTGGASVSVVSGGAGAQGTYKSLDTGAVTSGDKSPAVSHAATIKAERRAGMHISGPFSVTVPLHITSGLALGVLQGGRVEEEQLTQTLAEEVQPKTVKQEKDEDRELEELEVKETTEKKTEDLEEIKNDNIDNGHEGDAKKEDEKEEEKKDLPEERNESKEEDREEEFVSEEECKDERQDLSNRPSLSDGDYMVMRPVLPPCPTEAVEHSEDLSPQPLDISYPEHDLPLDFQDTFGFLDLMDTSASNQVNEFSVEPPAFEDEEEEEDKQSPSQHYPASLSYLDKEKPRLDLSTHSHRLQAGKSHSLPYKSRPFLPIACFSSDEDDYSGPDDDDDDDIESDKSEYEDMFYKSLPSSSHFQGLKWTCPPTFTITTTDQSDALNQTPTSELPENVQDLAPVDKPGILENQSETEIMANNEIDSSDQCLDEADFSPLPLEAECLTMDEKNCDGRNGEESEPDEACDVDEIMQEESKGLEITDSKEDTLSCSQEESHSINSEPQTNTCFCPDATFAFLELCNIDISCHSDQPFIKEEEIISDYQQESPEGDTDMAESEVTITNSTDSVLVAACDNAQSTVLSEETKILVECIVEEVEDRGDLGEKEKEDEREAVVEKMKREISDEQMNVETNAVAPEEVTNLDKNKKDEDEINFETQNQKTDGGENSDHGMVIDDVGEKTEDVKDVGVTEIKDKIVYEEEHTTSEDDPQCSSDVLLEEKVIEDKPADPVKTDSEEPVKYPRLEEIEKDSGVNLGPGVRRMVIASKHTSPKIYQVKAVPVVPPKPQHSKITAFKQQFQQNDTKQQQKSKQQIKKGNAEKVRINNPKMSHQQNSDSINDNTRQNHDAETEKKTDKEQLQEHKADQVKKQLRDTQAFHSFGGELRNDTEDHKQRRDTWDGGSLRKDIPRDVDRETKKVSSISICFDEAVARATGKLCREKELLEKDRLLDLQVEKFEQKEGLKQRQRDEDEKIN
ncbi:rho GTPase-activating protein 31 [Trichomycterus rosablanca]|uniref:rho GTPase-activating protein 31 n=1 Tax=Trichomycterus rosablanca TaxID=2290929 RepID=UPI002F354344